MSTMQRLADRGLIRPPMWRLEMHQIPGRDALGGQGRTYDLTSFGVSKFFNLAMENTPNIIDAPFTPRAYVLHSRRVGDLVSSARPGRSSIEGEVDLRRDHEGSQGDPPWRRDRGTAP